MKNSLKTTRITFVLMVIIGLMVIGLAIYAGIDNSGSGHRGNVTPSPSGQSTAVPGVRTDGDTTVFGVVMAVDIAEKTISVYIPERDAYLDLTYGGSTDIRTAYGNVVSASVLPHASIAEISFDAADRRLYHLYLTNDFWTIASANNWELALDKSMITIGTNNYRISANVATVSAEAFELKDLSAVDVVNFYGKGDRVYVVELVLGHGTLYLMNETNFVGGSLFLDNVYAAQITENMALSIREGSYEISFSKGDLNGRQEVSINRNGTAVINLEPYQELATEYGYVDFRIKPADAALFIDNYYYDWSEPVRLTYGPHQVEVVKQGYITWSGSITVGSELMKLPVELAEQFAQPTPTPDPDATPTEEPDPTPTPLPTNTPTPALTDTPSDNGEATVTLSWFPSSIVSVDGAYAGTTDSEGKLETTIKYGSHVIGLTRTVLDGTTTPKNYQITINADTPATLSFPTISN